MSTATSQLMIRYDIGATAVECLTASAASYDDDFHLTQKAVPEQSLTYHTSLQNTKQLQLQLQRQLKRQQIIAVIKTKSED